MEPDAAKPRPTKQRMTLLGIYLNDHLGGATGGLELVRRAARAHANTAAGQPLHELALEIAADRHTLMTTMQTLGIPVRGYKMATGWAAEKVGRLKPNGRLWSRSPLSSIIELESLRMGIDGKKACWQALHQLAPSDRRIDLTLLDELMARAEHQAETVEGLRKKAAANVFN